MKKPPFALVVWEDAKSLNPGEVWAIQRESYVYEPAIMHTAGFVLYDGPEGVIITGTWSDHCIAPEDQIPRGMVRSITYLDDQHGSTQTHRRRDPPRR